MNIFIIDNDQQCCESIGTITSDDNFEDYIGTTINHISTYRFVKEFIEDECEESDDYEPNIMSINFETSKGQLVFAVYNIYNGYYGHDAYILVNNKIESEKLL